MGIHYHLKVQMEAKRKEMIRSANANGFTSKQTVKYSQELDRLMNLYRQLTHGDSTTAETSEAFH